MNWITLGRAAAGASWRQRPTRRGSPKPRKNGNGREHGTNTDPGAARRHRPRPCRRLRRAVASDAAASGAAASGAHYTGDIDKEDAKFGDTAAWNGDTDLVDWGVAAGTVHVADIDKEDAQYGDKGAWNEDAE